MCPERRSPKHRHNWERLNCPVIDSTPIIDSTENDSTCPIIDSTETGLKDNSNTLNDSTKGGCQQPQCSGEQGLSPALSNALMASGAGHMTQASVDLSLKNQVESLVLPNVPTWSDIAYLGNDSTWSD